MPSWLSSHRKQALLDLSTEAGLPLDDSLHKPEIVEALDAFLQKNSTRLSRNEAFEGYYSRLGRATPFKTRASGGLTSGAEDGDVKSVVRGRGRRATRVKEEFDNVTSSPVPAASSAVIPRSTSLPKRTPGRPPRRQSQLAPSPADVADLAEYESTRLYASLSEFYSVSGIPETLDQIRDLCSSVTGIQLTFLILEWYALTRELVPWHYITTLSTLKSLIGGPTLDIWLPNLFALLEPSFWFPALLWSTTTFLIPGLVSYFYNLTFRTIRRHGILVSAARYTFDPLTFNIVKGLLTWSIYGQGWCVEALGHVTVAQVRDAMFGGYQGVLIGCYVCILGTLYEAAQRK